MISAMEGDRHSRRTNGTQAGDQEADPLKAKVLELGTLGVKVLFLKFPIYKV